LLTLCSCQSSTPPTTNNTAPVPSPTAATTASTASLHEHSAPHGGALIELGEEFAHLELVFETNTGKLTAFVLDGEAEKAVRLKQAEIELTLFKPAGVAKLSGIANTLTGETAQDSSEFSGTVELLKGLAAFEGIIKSVTVKGQQFKGVNFSYPQGSVTK